MRGSRMLCMLIFISFAVFIIWPVSAVGADKTFKLTCGIMVSEDYSFTKGARFFAEKIKEATKGQVEVEVFPNGVLGSEPQMFEAMKKGVLDMCVNSPVLLGPFIPEYQIYELPYIFQSAEHRDKVVSSPTGEKVNEMVRKKGGVVVLGDFGGTTRNLITRNKPVERLGEAKGIKLRIGFSPIQVATWNALGLKPISIAYGEAYTAFQTGVADAGENESATVMTSKWYEPLKYFNLTQHAITVRPLLVAEKKFMSMPPDIQKLMLKFGKEAAVYAVQIERDDDTRYMKELAEKYGMTIVQIKDKAAWIKATESVRNDFIKKYGLQDMYDEIVSLAK